LRDQIPLRKALPFKPRRGYRFIVPVENLDDSGRFMERVSRQGETATADQSHDSPGLARRRRSCLESIAMGLRLGAMVEKIAGLGRELAQSKRSSPSRNLKVFNCSSVTRDDSSKSASEACSRYCLANRN